MKDDAVRDNHLDWLTLTAVPGLGPALTHRMLTVFGSPAEVLAAGQNVARVEGVGRRLASVFSSRSLLDKARSWAGQELTRLRQAGIHLLCSDDPLYPSRLHTIHDPPVVLYCRGNTEKLKCLNKPSVGIVGSRAATSYGRRISNMLAARLARSGIVVVSGLALGIDGQAHSGVLAAGGETVGVLGCGVDVVYPRSHAKLYEQVAAQGVLVSEYPLGSRPEGFRFPARNRIISGLSLGVIVVEATCRSGSLITARMALEQGREVFAVPGRIDSGKSEGTHRLIQQGAFLVQSAEDVVNELQLAAAMHPPEADEREQPAQEINQQEKQLLASLDVYPVNIDELAAATGLESSQLHDLLLRLELKGLIRQLPGQQYEVLVPPTRS